MDDGDKAPTVPDADQTDSEQSDFTTPGGRITANEPSVIGRTFNTWEPIYEPTYRAERFRHRSIRTLLAIACIMLIGIIGTVFGLFLIFGHHGHPLVGSLTIAASWLAAFSVITIPAYFTKLEIKFPDSSAGDAQRNHTDDERDANQRALLNYQRLTQKQATSSYRLAQFAILAGLLLLLGGVAVTVRASGTTTQLVVGGLSALGTTISAYVGATSIRVYNRTLSQMNFYYAQPLVQSYVLQAERLSQSLSRERKDVVLEKIITQTLAVASVAAHLIARAGDTPSGLFRTDGRGKEDKESEVGGDRSTEGQK
jgi:hypothetical protein